MVLTLGALCRPHASVTLRRQAHCCLIVCGMTQASIILGSFLRGRRSPSHPGLAGCCAEWAAVAASGHCSKGWLCIPASRSPRRQGPVELGLAPCIESSRRCGHERPSTCPEPAASTNKPAADVDGYTRRGPNRMRDDRRQATGGRRHPYSVVSLLCSKPSHLLSQHSNSTEVFQNQPCSGSF